MTVIDRLAIIGNRIYADFLMPSRLGAFEGLLENTLAAGYEILPVGEVWGLIMAGGIDPARRYLALRHDVDTDPGTAGAMWSIERRLGIRSSYFFRLSTLDLDLMTEIHAAGGEASYHYEELATIAKRRGLPSAEAALQHLDEACEEFAANITRLRMTTGLPMRVVASHGDFVNVRLGLANWVILADPVFRARVGIELETYDDKLLRHLPSRHTDLPHPRYWSPIDPADAVREERPVVSVLVHPRHWRVARFVNARDDVRRLVEGVMYGVRRRAGARR